MAKPQIAARIDERLDEQVERVMVKENIDSRSEALRYLVERGVEQHEQGNSKAPAGFVSALASQFAAMLAALAVVSAVIAAFGVTTPFVGIGLASTLLIPALLTSVGLYRGVFARLDQRLQEDARSAPSQVSNS